jgi:uncharacterized protein (UPF0332 family)
MSLQDWANDKFIERCSPSPKTISPLLQICERDLMQSGLKGLGMDWQLSIAYNAALQAATVALLASGYRVRKNEGHHYRVIQSLAFTINADTKLINKFDKFRQKRNISDYERVDTITQIEADAMVDLARNLRDTVVEWLKNNHPELLAE